MPINHSSVGGPAAVVTSDAWATDAAVQMLQQGGTAVDALVAAAAVQCVVQNGSTTVAGMWIAHLYDAASGATTNISSKIGPAAAESYDWGMESPEAYSGRAMPVPAWVAGAHRTWESGGRSRWSAVLAPAIELAEGGYLLEQTGYARVRTSTCMTRSQGGRDIWMRAGRYAHVGERIVQPQLARTLRDVAAGGPAAFYEGQFARDYVATAQSLRGRLTMADMARWPERVTVRPAPLEGDFCGMQVVTAGGLMVYALHLAQAAGVSSLDDPGDVYALTRILEEAFHATRDYGPATHDKYVDRGFAESRIDDVLHQPLRAPSFDHFWSNTNTIVVRDAAGNVAWLVHSINANAGIVVNGAYVVKAISRTHARTGNQLAPGIFAKLALYRDGRPHIVAASPGHGCMHGPTLFAVGAAQCGLDAWSAVSAPRFGLPSAITGNRPPYEGNYPRAVFDLLEQKQVPHFQSSPHTETGLVGAVVIDGDRVHAVHDPRADGAVATLST